MANICFNTIKIKGNPQKIELFFNKYFINKEELDLGNFYKIPSDLSEQELDNFCMSEFGIRSRYLYVDEVNLENDSKVIELICNTKWSPPVEAMEKLSKKLKGFEVSIFFHEGGMDFMGFEKFKNGISIYKKDGLPSDFEFKNLVFLTDSLKIENGSLICDVTVDVAEMNENCFLNATYETIKDKISINFMKFKECEYDLEKIDYSIVIFEEHMIDECVFENKITKELSIGFKKAIELKFLNEEIDNLEIDKKNKQRKFKV